METHYITGQTLLPRLSLSSPSRYSGKYEADVLLRGADLDRVQRILEELQNATGAEKLPLKEDHDCNVILKCRNRQQPPIFDSHDQRVDTKNFKLWGGCSGCVDVSLIPYNFVDGSVRITGIYARLNAVQICDFVGRCQFEIMEDGFDVMKWEPNENDE